MSVRVVGVVRVPVIDLRATGQNIKNLRVAAGISVRDLQNILGFTNPQAIYKWQNGDSLPSIDNLVILAAILGVTVDEILMVEGDSSGDGETVLKGSVITGISFRKESSRKRVPPCDKYAPLSQSGRGDGFRIHKVQVRVLCGAPTYLVRLKQRTRSYGLRNVGWIPTRDTMIFSSNGRIPDF